MPSAGKGFSAAPVPRLIGGSDPQRRLALAGFTTSEEWQESFDRRLAGAK
jgi:hypothetical protein